MLIKPYLAIIPELERRYNRNSIQDRSNDKAATSFLDKYLLPSFLSQDGRSVNQKLPTNLELLISENK